MAIRIAAIGVGHWHSLYDAAYLKTLVGMDGAELVAVHDADAAMVASRAAALGDPQAFTDHREMLHRVRPDFVIVLGRHCDMAAAADLLLDQGVAFLMEKPAGIDADEVRRIADKARAKRAFAAVPLFQRFHPFFAHAKRIMAEQPYGPLSHFYFRSIRPTSARYVDWGAPWMLDPQLAGGGCLRNIGLHGVDAFVHLTGPDAKVLGAALSARALGTKVEDHAAVLLRSADGVAATIEVGNTFPGKGADAEWKLSWRDATLIQRGGAVHLLTAAGEQALPAEMPGPLPACALKDALRRWEAGEPPAASLDDCFHAMRLVDLAYRAAAEAEERE